MISIICSTYNRPECLKRLVENIKEQTHQDWELLIMDESEDFYSKGHEGEKIIAHKCARYNDWGYSVKEIGAFLAQGEYLCFPADDATYDKTFLEKLNTGHDFVYCDFTHNGNYLNARPQICAIDVGGFLIKRDVFLDIRFFDKGDLGDGKFVEEVIKRGHSHHKINETLYYKV